MLQHDLTAMVMSRDRSDQLTTRLHFAYMETAAPLLEDMM